MTEMPSVVFDMPWVLVAAVVLPALVLLMRAWRAREWRTRLGRLAVPDALLRLVRGNPTMSRSRTVRLALVMLLSGIALAGPRWGLAKGPSTARGIDMAIALDASLSMMATDDRPSRLERMKQEVRRLRAMSRADRVALIAFAGRSYILTPLTGDDGAIELFLDNLDPGIVGQAGSSIAKAIRQGTDLLLASDGGADRALVIMTDGEVFEPAEDVEAAAREAGEQGISLVAVGFGTEKGSTIPVREGNVVQQKRDADGKIVVTRYNPELLQRAANAANGTFVAADASDKATRIRAALRSLKTARRTVDSREDHVPRFLWALVPALLLLLYDTWSVQRFARPQTRSTKTNTKPMVPIAANAGTLAAVLVTVAIAGGCAKPPDPAVMFANGDVFGAIAAYRVMVAEGDTTALTRYNLGTALIGADSLAEAVELLERVRRSTDGELRMRARYNAGLAQLEIGRKVEKSQAAQFFAAARLALRSLLEDRAVDMDAKWNYELALRDDPPNSGGGGGGNSNAQNEQQDEPQPQGALDQRQAEALLNSAAREERDVQGRKQNQGKVPPVGKDW